MRSRPQHALLIIASMSLTLLACELYLWFAVPIGDPFVTHNPFLALTLYPDPMIMPNTSTPTHFTTDRNGFRTNHPFDCRLKPPLTKRIILIGGSTTEEFFSDDHRTWGHLLEERLNYRLQPYGLVSEVINAGRGGTASADHYYLAYQLIDCHPDLIIYLVGANDMTAYLRHGLTPIVTETKAAIRTIAMSSQLVRRMTYLQRIVFARDRVFRDTTNHGLTTSRRKSQALPLHPMSDEVKQVPPFYAHNIEQIISLHRKHNVNALLITQPTLWRDNLPQELEVLLDTSIGTAGGVTARYSSGELDTLMERYNDVLRAKAVIGKPIYLLDLARLLVKDSSVFYDDLHFNDLGNERIAEILESTLLHSRALMLP